jgi:hypothetical protein
MEQGYVMPQKRKRAKTSRKLEQLRSELQKLAIQEGVEWADKVVTLIKKPKDDGGSWTNEENQELLDTGANYFEELCDHRVETFRKDGSPEQDIANFIEDARLAFQKRLAEIVLSATAGRA